MAGMPSLHESYDKTVTRSVAACERDVASMVRSYVDIVAASAKKSGSEALVGEAERKLVDTYSHIVGAYGNGVAEAAAVYYDEARELAEEFRGTKKRFKAIAAAQVPDEILRDDVYVHLNAYRNGTSDAAALSSAMAGSAVRRILTQGDETIRGSAKKDPRKPGWAIVPHPGACGYCIMLGSRGFVYGSDETAQAARHNGCKGCRTVISFDGKRIRELKYDPVGMRSRYEMCRDAIGDTWQVDWLSMSDEERAEYVERWGRRKGAKDADASLAQDHFYQRAIVDEMNTRDRQWLFDGTIPSPSYATESIKKSVTIDNPWEERSGRRLAAYGIRPDFAIDYHYIVGDDGIKRRRGLPDLEDGTEIKTPILSENPVGAVMNYFDNVMNKKDNVKRVVIDNSESKFSDEQLRTAITDEMGRYTLPKIMMLCKSGKLVYV